MGGSSLGGMFGGSSTIGSNAYAPANTTPSVMGAQGKLEAFNPTTMAGTYNTPTSPTMANFTSAGMDAATGLPSYVTNFLQQGGSGTLAAPQYTMDPGAGTVQQGTAVVPKNVMPKLTGKGGYGGPADIPNKVGPAKPGTTTSTTDPMTGMTMIPFNAPGGYNQPGLQQPMAVSDQYNPMTGSSNQIASPPVGGVRNAPQVMGGGIYMDGKGGYFSKDPTGKMVPMTGSSLQTAQSVAQAFGYR